MGIVATYIQMQMEKYASAARRRRKQLGKVEGLTEFAGPNSKPMKAGTVKNAPHLPKVPKIGDFSQAPSFGPKQGWAFGAEGGTTVGMGQGRSGRIMDMRQDLRHNPIAIAQTTAADSQKFTSQAVQANTPKTEIKAPGLSLQDQAARSSRKAVNAHNKAVINSRDTIRMGKDGVIQVDKSNLIQQVPETQTLPARKTKLPKPSTTPGGGTRPSGSLGEAITSSAKGAKGKFSKAGLAKTFGALLLAGTAYKLGRTVGSETKAREMNTKYRRTRGVT